MKRLALISAQISTLVALANPRPRQEAQKTEWVVPGALNSASNLTILMTTVGAGLNPAADAADSFPMILRVAALLGGSRHSVNATRRFGGHRIL